MKKYKSLAILGILLFNLNIFGQNKLSKPERNFEYLWNLFNEKYASFEEKNIDWNVKYKTYRTEVTSKTTDLELFNVFKNMLRPLNDGHVSLKANSIDAKFSARKSSKILQELKSIKNKREVIHKMTNNTLSKLGFAPVIEIGPKFRGNKLFGYTNNSSVGYLRFHRCFSKYALMNGPFLNRQLEKIFKSFSHLDALILDVRFNIGGDDKFSNKIVGRLVQDRILGYYKQGKKNKESFEPLQPKYIKSRGKSKFLKKVYLLTNDMTVSAADVLALMMQQLKNVTIVGDNTNGSFSDIYSKRLPNGWRINLSDERYFSPNMTNYEGVGVPVDVFVHTTLKDIIDENDPVLLKVIDLIVK
jgi:hypothetical protein